MKFKESLNLFLLAKKSEFLAEKTLTFYQQNIHAFCLYALDNDVLSFDEMSTELIQAYLVYLREERQQRSVSVNDAYKAIRAWIKYLYKKQYIPRCYTDGVKAPKIAAKIPRTFTPEEVKKMFAVCDTNTFLGLRDKAILSLILATGMRKEEICKLKNQNINFLAGLIKVDGKGAKQREIPIGRALVKVLKDYRCARDNKLFMFKTQEFFVTNQGKPINVWTMASIFRRIKAKSGIDGERVSAHTWRHTFAKSYLMNGGDVFSLQKIMGHSDLTTTKRYLNLNTNEIKKQYDKFNPLENLEWML